MKSGFTLVETLICTALLGISVYAFVGSRTFFQRRTSKVEDKISTERIALSLFGTINQNVYRYQVTNKPDTFINNTDKQSLLEDLPMAWNKKGFFEKSACPGCAGRMGFIVYPHGTLEYRGIYRLKIRFVHRSLFEHYKDYDFLITGN